MVARRELAAEQTPEAEPAASAVSESELAAVKAEIEEARRVGRVVC